MSTPTPTLLVRALFEKPATLIRSQPIYADCAAYHRAGGPSLFLFWLFEMRGRR